MRRFMVLLLLMALVPSAAARAEDSDKALSLRAFADHLDGGLVSPSDEEVLAIDPWGHAEVSMPPQTDGSTARSTRTTAYLMGDVLVVERDDKEDIANGNLAAGTVEASSYTRNLKISVMGVGIDVRGVRAESRANCDGPLTPEQAAAGSSVASLVIDGQTYAVGEPNQFSTTVDLPDGKGRIDIDALTVRPAHDGTGWTTTGLRLRVHAFLPPPWSADSSTVAELVVGTAKTEITCA